MGLLTRSRQIVLEPFKRNDTLFRVVVLVLGTIPVALVVAAVLTSPS
jgi:hypothetical protein